MFLLPLAQLDDEPMLGKTWLEGGPTYSASQHSVGKESIDLFG
jgi:hypothetical protein